MCLINRKMTDIRGQSPKLHYLHNSTLNPLHFSFHSRFYSRVSSSRNRLWIRNLLGRNSLWQFGDSRKSHWWVIDPDRWRSKSRKKSSRKKYYSQWRDSYDLIKTHFICSSVEEILSYTCLTEITTDKWIVISAILAAILVAILAATVFFIWGSNSGRSSFMIPFLFVTLFGVMAQIGQLRVR